MSALDPRIRARNESLLRTASRIPMLRVGDEWTFVFGFSPKKFARTLKITKFSEVEPNPDGTFFPWPLVHVVELDGTTHDPRGAPSFIHGKLKKRGRGRKWTPPVSDSLPQASG